MSRQILVSLALIAITLSSNITICESAASDARAKQFVLGFLSNRENLRVAKFDIDEKLTFLKDRKVRYVQRTIAIDNDAGFYRIDAALQYEGGGPAKDFSIISNDEYNGLLSQQAGTFSIRAPGTVDEGYGMTMPRLEVLGLMPLPDYRVGTTVEQFRELFSNAKKYRIDETGNQIVIEWWPDTANASEIVFRHVFRADGGIRPTSTTMTTSQHQYNVQTEWEQHSGVWLPTACMMKTNTVRKDLAFNWKSVNEPIDSKHFFREGLELDQGIAVVDHRLEKPVIEEIVGRTFGKHRDKALYRTKLNRIRGAIAILVVLVIVSLVEFYFWNRGRKGS